MTPAEGLLGLSARAGKVISGQENVEQAVKRGSALLVILDGEISPGSEKAVRDACRFYGAPCVRLDAGLLGRSIGKPGRMVAAITDQALAKRLQDMLSTTSIG